MGASGRSSASGPLITACESGVKLHLLQAGPDLGIDHHIDACGDSRIDGPLYGRADIGGILDELAVSTTLGMSSALVKAAQIRDKGGAQAAGDLRLHEPVLRMAFMPQ